MLIHIVVLVVEVQLLQVFLQLVLMSELEAQVQHQVLTEHQQQELVVEVVEVQVVVVLVELVVEVVEEVHLLQEQEQQEQLTQVVAVVAQENLMHLMVQV
tara:strand:+ start:396 stop:695 length:300 start_codon:yes stop_codon:yes gene_type:complete